MRPVVLDVLNAAPRDVFETEFPFVKRHEFSHDRIGIGSDWGIDMDVMHGAIGATVRGDRDEFTKLFRQSC